MKCLIMMKVAADEVKKKRNYLPYIAGGVGLAAIGFGTSKLLRKRKILTGVNKSLEEISIGRSLHDTSIGKAINDIINKGPR